MATKGDRFTITEKLREIDWATGDLRVNLDQAYQIVDNYIVSEGEWYRRHVKRKRQFAQGLQIVCSILLIIGVTIPLVGSAMVNGNAIPDWAKAFFTAQIGYIALIVAALALLFDKVFQFSSGWERYLWNEMKLFGQVIDTRFQWISLKTTWSQNIESKDVKDALNFLNNQADEAVKVVQDEIQSWSTELQNALNLLQNRIDSASATVQPQINVAKTGIDSTYDPKNGTIIVEAQGVGNQTEIMVFLGGGSLITEKEEPLIPPGTVIFDHLTAGKYLIRVVAQIDTNQKVIKQQVCNLNKGEDQTKLFNFLETETRINGNGNPVNPVEVDSNLGNH